MVERSLSMGEVPGSMPGCSNNFLSFFFLLDTERTFVFAFLSLVLGNMEDEKAGMIEMIQKLVAIPSINGQHNEKDVVDYLLEQGAMLGLKGQIYTNPESDRPNIVFSIGEGPPKFLFVAHLDTGKHYLTLKQLLRCASVVICYPYSIDFVVAVGDTHKWKHPPFSGTIDEGKLYARGACDNKAGIGDIIPSYQYLATN